MNHNYFKITFSATSMFVTLFLGIVVVVAQQNQPEEAASTVSAGSFQAYDAHNNLVIDENGTKFNYLLQPDNQFIRVPYQEDAPEIPGGAFPRYLTYPASPARMVAPPMNLFSPQETGEYLEIKWTTSIWGTGIGGNGLVAQDIDQDGEVEIVAGGGYFFDYNRFWYVLSYSPSEVSYRQEWVSQEYSIYIYRLIVADIHNNGRYSILVALEDGTIYIHDGVTREVVGTFTSIVGPRDIVIADLDQDGENEIVVTSFNGMAVYNAVTYSLEWNIPQFDSGDIEVANVDMDSALEIVTHNRVIDGVSHAVEWYYPEVFGGILQLADIDNDNMAEIIAAEGWYQIHAYDVDTQAPKWSISTPKDIEALVVADFDQDGVQEVVYGDGQWGKVRVINSQTLTLEWSINNPEHGVTRIAFGDVDNDQTLEILWGAGWTLNGPDYLYVASTTTHIVEWQNRDLGRPLKAAVGDVDNDGADEIVVLAPYTNSFYDEAALLIYDANTYALEWSYDFPESSPKAHALELANIDNDEALEILIGVSDLHDGSMMGLDGLTHDLEWQTPVYYGASFSSIVVDDVDNDGALEVIGGQMLLSSGAPGIYVRIFDATTGVEEWHTENVTNSGAVYDIDTGDFDNDGHAEILFAVSPDGAYVYDAITHLEEWASTFGYTVSVAGEDVDQDGVIELLIGLLNGRIFAINGQTYAVEWDEPLGDFRVSSIQLTDFDHNQEPELTITDESSLFVYDAATHGLIWESLPLASHWVGENGNVIIKDLDGDTWNELVVGSNYAVHVLEYQPPYTSSFHLFLPLAIYLDS